MTKKRPAQNKIDNEQLEKLMMYMPTSNEAAHFFKVGRSSLIRYIEDKHDMTYLEFRNYHMSGMKLKLKRECLKRAFEDKDAGMLRFCMVNMNNWHHGHQQLKSFDEDEQVEDIEWVD